MLSALTSFVPKFLNQIYVCHGLLSSPFSFVLCHVYIVSTLMGATLLGAFQKHFVLIALMHFVKLHNMLTVSISLFVLYV